MNGRLIHKCIIPQKTTVALIALCVFCPATLSAEPRKTASCTFQPSGPVVVSYDGQIIHDLDITALGTTPGIDTNGHNNVSIYSVKIHHSSGAGILIQGGAGIAVQAVNIDGRGQTPGINIACYNSPSLWVNNSKLYRGASGIVLYSCNSSTLSNIEGHDQIGAFPGGDFVQWIYSSDGTLSNFSNLNVPPNPSQGDTVNAWGSSNIHVSYGLIDGNYTPNGSGVQADEATSNMFVDNVDVIHAMNSGFAAYGAGGDTAAFSNVRVRDTVCSSSQGLPSSGGIAFIGPVLGSGTKTNVSFDNAVYFNLCNSVTPVYNQAGMVRGSFTHADFKPRTPFKANVCQ